MRDISLYLERGYINEFIMINFNYRKLVNPHKPYGCHCHQLISAG